MPIGVRSRLVAAAGLGAVAACAALAPLPSSAVERLYSTRLYPAIQAPLTRSSNVTGTAWFDVLIAAAAIAFAILFAVDVARRGWIRGVLLAALRLVTWCAGIYLAFL